MKHAHFAAIPLSLCAAACAPASGGNASSSSATESAAATGGDAGGCPAGDAAAFAVRASCVYGIASDAATLSACDEWSQAPGGDWSSFIDGCTGKNGALSSAPCTTTGSVGTCVFPATCENQMRTYSFGPSGASSFESACLASAGATWTAD